MALRVDIVAELNERAAAAAANRLKGQMIRAGEVSGEAFSAALEKEAQRSKIATDKLQAELRSQFTKHGEHAGMSFGTGFGAQLTRSLPGVSGFASTMAGYEGAAAKSGALAGRALGMAFTTAAGGLMGAAAYTLFKGFERYETINAATHRLQNLSKTMQAAGQTGLDVAAIMKTVNDVVLGTPIGLDKAMGAVTVALGSGVKQGDELKRYLTDIADAAGYSGRSFEEIALVFGQVQAKGRLMGEEVLQLAEKNIPAAAWLKDTFKLTGDEYERMQEKGQISLKALEMAIEQHAGGQAKAMGETIQGAISNVQSSVSRAGANFLAAIFGKPTDQNNTMVEALKSIKDRLDEMGAWVTANQQEIHNFFKNAAETARELGRVLGEVLRYLGEHEGAIKAVAVAFGAWKAIDGVASLITSLQTISTMLSTTLPASASAGAAGMTAALGPILAELATAAALFNLNGSAPSPNLGPGANDRQDKLDAGKKYFDQNHQMPPGYQQWLDGKGPMPSELGPFYRGNVSGTPFFDSQGRPLKADGTPFGPTAPGPYDPRMPKSTAPGTPGAPAPGQPGWDNSNPFLSPRSKPGEAHLPKAPVVPYDTALPPGFENLPMSSGLYSAESSFLDSRQKLAEKRARLAQLENDATATEQDRLDARNDVITAGRDLQQSEMRLYEERGSIFTKHNKQIKTWLSELGDIGASLDQDFGISKGLAGIAENITKFIANLAAAPILGQLGASQIAAGYKPGEAGQGAFGMLAASGALGPQYQIQGSLFGGGQGGAVGMPGQSYPAIMGPLPGLSVPPGTSVYPGAHTSNTGGALVPRAAAVKSMLQQAFPGLDIGGWRPPDKFGEHSSGEALDIMVGGNKALGDQINQYLLANAGALGLQYDLWQQQTWKPGQAPTMMENRGSGTQNHMDHVHARFQPGPLTGGDGGGSWYPAAPGATGAGAAPGVAPSGFTTGPGGSLSVAPAGMGGPGGVPLAPGGGGGSWWGGPGPGGPQPGVPGPGLPGLPQTANPTRIGGEAAPQGKGSGGVGLGGLAMAGIQAGIGAAGMAGAPFGGQAGAAAAQAMIELANRGIKFAGQAAGIGVQGLMETFLPAGSELANNNWITKIAGGLAGATPMLPNIAGKGDDDGSGPTPEQVVGQGQGPDGRPAGLPDPAAPAGNTDNSKNVTNNLTIQAAPAQNENSMGNTVTSHLAEMYST